MPDRVQRGQLSVDKALDAFVVDDILPATGISADIFWQGFEKIINTYAEENKSLIAKRQELQTAINAWNKSNVLNENSMDDYIAFLQKIGYVVPEGDDFQLQTEHIDDEIAKIAGPQLVVPASNARFALNAANARWGSLYDALYGTDALGIEQEQQGRTNSLCHDSARGKKVVEWGIRFLDKALPLKQGSHGNVISYDINSQSLPAILSIKLEDGSSTSLQDESAWIGYSDTIDDKKLLFIHHQLHIECCINKNNSTQQTAKSGMSDIILEAAVSTIVDLEDSVAAVDAQDKIESYRHWLGLIKGNLQVTIKKKSTTIPRQLNADKTYNAVAGGSLILHGRSLLLVRNVGHLMTTDCVLDKNGKEVPEGMLDALVTTACSIHDIKNNGQYKNSRTGSIYIVKPKMHGPDEVALTNKLLGTVEEILGLAINTVKVGVMDEERRTSANLKECIRAVQNRLFFINTGFLDRTGDEIHTSMNLGAIFPKGDIKKQHWLPSYENRNVTIGLQCGLKGRAQIGKGMWAKPEKMEEMLQTKAVQLQEGANCAWVPSPTAAVLHATHYHSILVSDRQDSLRRRACGSLSDLLTPMLLEKQILSADVIQSELNNNAQSILGYVVRWINHGVGCSKVPDINNVGLMEDRATLRISSQHIANWLMHGLCSEQQIRQTFEKMAAVVDKQNASDSRYISMGPDFSNSIAFTAACQLVFAGAEQPNGYTEPLLHYYRRQFKNQSQGY